MKGINLTRVLLGGLAAGIVINLGEFVLWGVILEQQYTAMMATFGLAETSWAMAAYIIGSLVLGVALAFTYAAIRPRFGARWQTGVVAAGVIWVAGVALPMIWNGAIGIGVGAGATLLALVWTAVELSLAAVAAAWVYQEQEAPAVASQPTY
ncbi:MAG TPA: hypothetical protein VMM12_09500 [Longimicrobiales bacterium]|nr:hypothetical protein [Longimicrobiales bacterium]